MACLHRRQLASNTLLGILKTIKCQDCSATLITIKTPRATLDHAIRAGDLLTITAGGRRWKKIASENEVLPDIEFDEAGEPLMPPGWEEIQ